MNENTVIRLSDNIVKREIQGQVILVPISAGVGELNDKLFSANDQGKDILNLTDGVKNIGDVADALLKTYDADKALLIKDIESFYADLLSKKLAEKVL